jgi:Uma2 family endonuclease
VSQALQSEQVSRQVPRRHAITIAECARMAAAGVFAPGVRMELIEGELIETAPIGDAHANVVSVLAALLIEALGARRVRIQQPLVLSETSRPEPDIVVLRDPVPVPPRLDWCPRAADAALVVEVADTSLAHDRRKAALYAASGIQEMLVVDVQQRCIVQLTDPGEGGFTQRRTWAAGEAIQLESVPVTIAVSHLFPI